MLPFEDRYTRQRQLEEVGLEGQARLQTTPFRLADSDLLSHNAFVVAADYLRRAGVPIETSPDGSEPEIPTSESRTSTLAHFRFAGPTEVAAGALMALHHIRSVLGLAVPARSSVDSSPSVRPRGR